MQARICVLRCPSKSNYNKLARERYERRHRHEGETGVDKGGRAMAVQGGMGGERWAKRGGQTGSERKWSRGSRIGEKRKGDTIRAKDTEKSL